MTPATIRMFTALFWAACALSVADAALQWPLMIEEMSAGLYSQGLTEQEAVGISRIVVFFSMLALFALAFLLWYFIARKRLGFFRWPLLLFAIWPIFFAVRDVMAGLDGDLFQALELASAGLLALSLGCLFAPASRQWFAGRHEA